ncbi:hypothetical protein BKA57DRAFT_456366, partial [Linnemannia elongata]
MSAKWGNLFRRVFLPLPLPLFPFHAVGCPMTFTSNHGWKLSVLLILSPWYSTHFFVFVFWFITKVRCITDRQCYH